ERHFVAQPPGQAVRRTHPDVAAAPPQVPDAEGPYGAAGDVVVRGVTGLVAHLGGGHVVRRYDAKPYDGGRGGAERTYNVASWRHATAFHLVCLPQIPPRHFTRRFDVEHAKHRGTHIAQGTAVPQRPRHVVAHDEERNGIRRVRRVRAARGGLDHQLAVAVVGGHDQ